MRLHLPYNGWVEIGLLPESDGYGNANVNICVVVSYNDGWIALKRNQLPNFFINLRNNIQRYIPGRVYYDESDDYLNGRFNIERNGDFFNIIFFDEDNDESYIENFAIEDLIPLLQMESIIAGRVDSISYEMQGVIGVIDETAIKCRHDASSILQLAESWSCDETIVQLAVNHFTFFTGFVAEFFEHNRENNSLF